MARIDRAKGGKKLTDQEPKDACFRAREEEVGELEN